MAKILDSAILNHKLAKLRDKDTKMAQFATLINEISSLMVYETLKDVKTKTITVETPLEKCEQKVLAQDVVLIPIIRAGLGMIPGFRASLPTAKVAHIGLARDEETLEPVEYYANFPADIKTSLCVVTDPMLATGGSAAVAIEKIKERGAQDIILACIVASPEGVKYVEENHPDVKIVVAALDRQLNDKGYIVPGLGDAGDRLYGTK